MRPKRNPRVVWRVEEGMRELAWELARKGEDYDDLGVLTLAVGESVHQLNLLGAEVWTRINGIRAVETIAAEVASLFRLDPEEMRSEVTAFLTDLEAKGWVTLGAPPSPPVPRQAAR